MDGREIKKVKEEEILLVDIIVLYGKVLSIKEKISGHVK
jgi:hypothetical protein